MIISNFAPLPGSTSAHLDVAGPKIPKKGDGEEKFTKSWVKRISYLKGATFEAGVCVNLLDIEQVTAAGEPSTDNS